MNKIEARYWQDPLFFAAMAAALLYWLTLYLITQPEVDAGWPLREPLHFLYPALLYPIVEEWIFRGFVQELAHRHLQPWSLGPLSHANILTSLLFTALHFINHPPLAAAMVFIPSLVFGFFKDRSGQLAAPVLLHIFYNSGYFWIFTH
ncbi:MAG: JDVT-CTERM system glutamic-type intramembrane protease [Pseudomonadota bacterium]|nr:JDVT-CTERM system glutamic-type intramembrane protease [Pseudomonadota bacterium]